MKPSKSFREAVGRVIAVFQRYVDDFPVRCGKLTAGKRESALADIFTHREAT